MLSTSVLVIGGQGDRVQSVHQVVTSTRQCRFETVRTVGAALERLSLGGVGLVLALLDSACGESHVAGLLEAMSAWRRPVPVIVLSNADNPHQRLSWLKRGAVDCLSWPVDLSRLAFLVDLLTIRARYEGSLVEPAVADEVDTTPDGDFLYASPPMRSLMKQIRSVAPLETTILINGETGTGKTHLGRVIHDLSPRRNKPFQVIHCGALTPELLCSELFGHVRGAFTSADRDRAGKFTEAADGTVLLDEVDCVPLEAQAKLLRAVEERHFEPVGSTKTQKLRARLVVATNRNLEEDVAAGRFRSDLYYRFNVVSFRLPPLRERREVIRPLVRKFLDEFSTRAGRTLPVISAAAMAAMAAYEWPGNIRELRNVIERAVALCSKSTIPLADLPEAIQEAGVTGHTDGDSQRVVEEPVPAAVSGRNGLEVARKEAERSRLLEVLSRNNNNRTNAAAELGVSRVTLYKKLHRYGLT